MEKSYSETMALRACHCDIHGEWRPGAILEAMQETATTHCEHLGLGRSVTDALGVAWVLSRCRVAFSRVPRMGEAVAVQTWALAPKHMFYPRINAFLDAEGREIGSATSLWVLLDLKTRRIVNRDEVTSRLPDSAGLPEGIPLGAIRPLGGEVRTRLLEPPYCDFDLNGHVNNTKYLDWACNALGHGALSERRVSAFAVCYDAELLPGVEARTELALREDAFSFCGFEGDRRCFCVTGTLQPR